MSNTIKVYNKLQLVLNSKLATNSIWGVGASAIQSILLSLFFVILARKYPTTDFASFLIANTIYQFLAAFSSLGLGQWFTREILANEENKQAITSKFIKMQFYSGIFFYLASILLVHFLYEDKTIRLLVILLGINIIFDNIIYGIKNLNIAIFQQKKTTIILVIDSILKFSVAASLYISSFSTFTLSLLLIITRFFTLNFFLAYGSSQIISFRLLYKYSVSYKEFGQVLYKNWAFVIVGSISIAYWRISNIIVSKMLTLADVAHFEISFRVFSLVQLLPFVVSVSLFPALIEWYKSNDMEKFKRNYKRIFNYYLLYGLLCFTFFYAFSDFLIPFAFSKSYSETPLYTKQMFLTILLFPTAIMQATMLTALHLEKTDMWLNIISLLANVVFALVGLYFIKSLSVVNYSIFLSFLLFHVLQDCVLIKRKIYNLGHAVKFYSITAITVICFILLYNKLPYPWLFFAFWGILALFIATTERRHLK